MIQDKLLALRKRSGMSQQEVADTVGVTRQTISNWELGQGSPTLDKAAELARLYGVSLDDFASDEVEIVTRERCERKHDFHILKSLVGKTATLELADSVADDIIKHATVLDVSDGWMRVNYDQTTAMFGSPKTKRKRVIRLIDIADITAVIVESDAPSSGIAQTSQESNLA